MCLAIPMQVIKKQGRFAQVRTGGLVRQINIQMLSQVTIGDYVIVHAGFAIEKIDSQAAKETLRLIEEL